MKLPDIWKEFRKKIQKRRQSKIKADLTCNTVSIPHNGIFCLEIKGKNNIVTLPENSNLNNVIKIKIYGDNNKISLNTENYINLKINIGDSLSPSCNCTVSVGENTQINGAEIVLYEHNSSVTIGKDCLLSWDIVLWCTDTHTVTDLSGTPLNRGRSVTVGDHVWIGRNVYIAKNTQIPSHSIVGWCSNVTSRFNEENVIIAGNPAKIVKRQIDWKHERFNEISPC